MELSEVLLKRRSVRRFTAEPVCDDMVETMMHAAMSGPSACNLKPWEFYAVTAPEVLEKLRSASRYTKITAPLAIVAAGNPERFLPPEFSSFWVQDVSAATENLLLCAVDLGLGAVWCGIHPQRDAEQRVSEALSLPAGQIPLNLIWVGHPAEEPEARDQYDAKYVHYIR